MTDFPSTVRFRVRREFSGRDGMRSIYGMLGQALGGVFFGPFIGKLLSDVTMPDRKPVLWRPALRLVP